MLLPWISRVHRLAFAVLATSPLAGFAADVPLSPAAAERLLGRTADVTKEFKQLIQRAGDSGDENLATLADTESPAWRLYYRDRQILFAVPSRRNLTGAQKRLGEADAARLAAVMLQQQFQVDLQLQPGDGLEQESVRVVFIEPAAHEIAAGGWSGGALGRGGCSQALGMHAGFTGTPLPFAAAGFWPSVAGGYASDCGCR